MPAKKPSRPWWISFACWIKVRHTKPTVILLLGTWKSFTVGDILTDSVLKAADCRGGKAHDGIQRAAKRMVETYKDDLYQLLQDRGRKKLKLYLMGHSLGAGTAALTAIEFIECCSSWVEAEALGFGTPAVLSPDLSYKNRKAITTVVTDADCVPRTFGATLVNAWQRIITHYHGDDVLLEFDQFTKVMLSKLPILGQAVATNFIKDVRSWIVDSMQCRLQAQIEKALKSGVAISQPD